MHSHQYGSGKQEMLPHPPPLSQFTFFTLPVGPCVVAWVNNQAGSVHASTSADVLSRLQGKHAVVAPVLEFRGVHKYKTT